jgi:hypothetical protein
MSTKDLPHAVTGRSKLLDQVRDAIRRRRYSLRTEATYIHWMKRSIYFSRASCPL